MLFETSMNASKPGPIILWASQLIFPSSIKVLFQIAQQNPSTVLLMFAIWDVLLKVRISVQFLSPTGMELELGGTLISGKTFWVTETKK